MQFPMIMSVIEGNSEGAIYCDNAQAPQHIFVRNKFGFCQEFFESFSEEFFQAIVDEIIEDRTRTKLRMYMPTEEMKEYLTGKENVTESERIHYIFCTKETHIKSEIFDGIRILTGGGTIQEDFGLELWNRYYKNKQDFMENALPIVAYDQNNNALGIIYSAAKGERNCEIDILVKEEYRKAGVGKALVSEFINLCKRKGIIPNWDCYANNKASVNLAKCSGFTPVASYCFYNIGIVLE